MLMAMSRKLKNEATEKQVEVLLNDAKEADGEVDNKEEDKLDLAMLSKEKEEETVSSRNKGW